MKTAKQWFETIEDKTVRNQAIENTYKEALEYEYASLPTAVECSFFWKSTDQGHEYWRDQYFKFYEQLKENQLKQEQS